MQTSIFADSELLAIKALRHKIQIHSIELIPEPSVLLDKEILDVEYLKSMLGIKY